MKRATMMMALFLLAGVSGMAWGHDSPCAHTHYVIYIGDYQYEYSRCDYPGENCNYAPCGAVGRCQNISHYSGTVEDCDCQQVDYNEVGTDWLNSSGLHLGSVETMLIQPGTTMTATFDPASAWNELVVTRNDEVELARISSIYSGSVQIRWLSEDTDYVYGELDNFELGFPSYEMEGQHTGVNHWLYTGPGWDVRYDREEGRVQLGQSLPLIQSNEVWSETGYLDLQLDTDHLQEGVVLIGLHATLGDPMPVPVAPEHWSAINQRYE